MTDLTKCRAMVYDPRGFHRWQCSRKGHIEEEGKLWCKTHAPSTIAAKEKKADERYQRETEAWRGRMAKDEARNNLVKTAVLFVNRECSHAALERAVREYEGLET